MADRTRGGRGVRSREGCAPAVLMRTPMAILDSVRHDVVYLWKQWSQKIKEPADADMLVFFGTLRRERSDLFSTGSRVIPGTRFTHG